jgi:hypothetical protein
MEYYTYAYLREDKTPYYIGKGKGRRIYERGGRHCGIPTDKSKVIFLKQNLTEAEAFRHEIYMIAVYGRKDLGTGILRNLTDGGDGTSGYIQTEISRIKMSLNTKGTIYWTDGIKNTTAKECPGKGWIKGRIDGRRWWNNGDINVFVVDFPGEGWISGRLLKTNKGTHRWNNGKENRQCKECPGKGWVMGWIIKSDKVNGNMGLKWWNNGIVSKKSKECPGDEWKSGRINEGVKYWNNGIKSISSKECPGEGWIRGRMSYRQSNKNQ